MKRTVVLVLPLVVVVAGFGGQAATARTGGAGATNSTKRSAEVPPPQVPTDFRWSGRYIVPDLGAEVPFTWEGRDGNFQMTAGGEGEVIHFSNFISDGSLYTVTYEWPGIPRLPCSNIGPYTLDDLNQGLAAARFVGPETLEDEKPRRVNHFRAGVVWEPGPEVIPPINGIPIRIPIMLGDVYVDRKNPMQFRKVLQFGLQNLYDVDLDEWIVIESSKRGPGTVTLPEECAAAQPPTTAPAAG